jgi:Rrf2 family protein
MLTKKGKYGLKALVHLAGLAPGATTQSFEIAMVNNIPKKFLDTILNDLRVAGMIRSKKGKRGGYMLARSADDIRVGPAIRVLDGPLAPIACASRFSYQPCDDCLDVEACSIRLTMVDVRDGMAEVLDNTTIEDMRRRSVTTDDALTYHI